MRSLTKCFSLLAFALVFSSVSFHALAEVCIKSGKSGKICAASKDALLKDLERRLETWRQRGLRAMKYKVRVDAELKRKDAEIKKLKALNENAEKSCEDRISTERIKWGKTIKVIPAPTCPKPIAEYISIGILSALVVGAGVGGYYLGQHLTVTAGVR